MPPVPRGRLPVSVPIGHFAGLKTAQLRVGDRQQRVDGLDLYTERRGNHVGCESRGPQPERYRVGVWQLGDDVA